MMMMMLRREQRRRLMLLALLLPARGAAFLASTSPSRRGGALVPAPACTVSSSGCTWWGSPSNRRRRRIPQPLLQTTSSDNDDSKEENSDDVIEYDDFGGKVIGGDTSSSSKNDASANVNFDDFGSQYVGDADDDKTAPVSSSSSSSSSTATVLQDRMASVTQQERRHEAVLGRNWKLGNWQVRGFSLEDVAATLVGASAGGENGEDADVDAPRQPEETTTLSEDDDALPPAVCQIAKDEDDPGQIWVGRTDGSVFGIRLGTSYWTRLQQNSDNNQAGSIQPEPPSQPLAMMGDEFDDDDEMETPPLPQSPPGKPFEIRTQLHAGSSPVTALVSAACSSTEDGDDTSYLFTATADSGIQQWLVMEQEDPKEPEGPKIILSKQFEGAHASQTVNFLRAVSLELDDDDDDSLAGAEAAPTVLLSADHSSIAVWDLATGDLLGQRCVGLESILDADYFPPNSLIQSVDTDGTHLFVGTSTGHVLAYKIADLLLSSRSSPPGDGTTATTPTTAKPVGQWKANSDGKPITALHCGGTGSMGARGSSRRTTSRTLYTGDADGGVKQWQVFAVNAGERLEHWPKLATQRLPQRAHLFRGHDAAVTALAAVDALKFVSASSDGTVRAWNAVTGKELFRMDGFTQDIHSLCLLDTVVRSNTDEVTMTTAANTLLVTDGMDKYVCLHDFSTNPDEDDDADYELDMPEYRD